MPTHDDTHVLQQTVGRRGFLLGAAGAVGATTLTLGESALADGSRSIGKVVPRPSIPKKDLDSLNLLKRMLSFDTQNHGQGGTTKAHAEMLKAVWDSAGVATEIIPTPVADNVHLIARIRGTNPANKPILILGHSDVVPVEKENWSVDPFGGVVKNEQIYGRGALDMKGANAAFISALLRHLAKGHTFDRDIIVLTDADEEAGEYGSGWLAKNHWEKLDAGVVLTEGGWFLAQRDQRTPMLISVTRQDKVYFNIDLTATGTATHSSKPMPDSAIVTLSRAVAELGDYLAPVHLTPVTRRYFAALADATEDRHWARAINMMLKAKDQRTRERAARLVASRSSYPYLHSALLRTTAAYVIEEAGYKENVVPSQATCRVNCRAVPGGQKPRDFLATVRAILRDKGVEVSLAAPPGVSEAEQLAALDATWATPPADVETPLYEALHAAAHLTYPDAQFTPALFEAGTSLKPWRAKGIPGYGVYPYVISNDQLIGMHGNDERIWVDALATGTDFMYRTFDRFRSR
ncbi:M20/M25/M40 family metallo-hydrolase [Gephyromycinifex aptenodytis]|uniref:M20/M25/M40 family metallo-hydrolase n=1 Tax=Gephyromycinifex aptenodytis TaxID=2716227 RepID=UPI001446CE90|nr:M20/M25/M40 family metallo-hydrolase [Gephyromycinifex aptenodytis]